MDITIILGLAVILSVVFGLWISGALKGDERVFELVSITNGFATCDIVYTVDGVERQTWGSVYGFTGVPLTTSSREWQHLIHWWKEEIEKIKEQNK